MVAMRKMSIDGILGQKDGVRVFRITGGDVADGNLLFAVTLVIKDVVFLHLLQQARLMRSSI